MHAHIMCKSRLEILFDFDAYCIAWIRKFKNDIHHSCNSVCACGASYMCIENAFTLIFNSLHTYILCHRRCWPKFRGWFRPFKLTKKSRGRMHQFSSFRIYPPFYFILLIKFISLEPVIKYLNEMRIIYAYRHALQNA